MICQICGDENGFLGGQWWSPDDGWRWGALCQNCWHDYGKVKPKKSDYAYQQKDILDVDQAIYDTEGSI